MKFVSDWPRLLLVSYSAWTLYALIAALIVPEYIYSQFGVDLNPQVFWIGSLVIAALGLLGRIVEQPPEGRWARRIVVGVILSALLGWAAPVVAMSELQVGDEGYGRIAPVATSVPAPAVIQRAAATGPTYRETAVHLVPLVKQWEGKHPCGDNRALHCSYFDTIASPPLWTVGYGHTVTARSGQRLTETEASSLLQRDLMNYWQQVRRGFTADTIAHRLTPQRDAAYASLGYNVGTAGVRGSTATRRLNAGDIAGGCTAIGWWNKAGGRVVRGLVNRRANEVALCRLGL